MISSLQDCLHRWMLAVLLYVGPRSLTCYFFLILTSQLQHFLQIEIIFTKSDSLVMTSCIKIYRLQPHSRLRIILSLLLSHAILFWLLAKIAYINERLLSVCMPAQGQIQRPTLLLHLSLSPCVCLFFVHQRFYSRLSYVSLVLGPYLLHRSEITFSLHSHCLTHHCR